MTRFRAKRRLSGTALTSPCSLQASSLGRDNGCFPPVHPLQPRRVRPERDEHELPVLGSVLLPHLRGRVDADQHQGHLRRPYLPDRQLECGGPADRVAALRPAAPDRAHPGPGVGTTHSIRRPRLSPPRPRSTTCGPGGSPAERNQLRIRNRHHLGSSDACLRLIGPHGDPSLCRLRR
jgi:hypothetical protein